MVFADGINLCALNPAPSEDKPNAIPRIDVTKTNPPYIVTPTLFMMMGIRIMPFI
jgi:hypothetical protein